MPVRVEKHCRRKFSVSRTSMPEGGSGRVFGSREGGGWRGCRRVVIACTLVSCFVSKYIRLSYEREGRGENGKGWENQGEVPVKCPC